MLKLLLHITKGKRIFHVFGKTYKVEVVSGVKFIMIIG